jgi:hypothetical protein
MLTLGQGESRSSRFCWEQEQIAPGCPPSLSEVSRAFIAQRFDFLKKSELKPNRRKSK